MKEIINGKVYVVQNDIDTDMIIPARYMTTMDPDELRKHAMQDLDPRVYPDPFLNKNGFTPFNIIVAGNNFGCGSSREHAPIALAAAGVKVVIANSFARIFYRNSVNSGLLLPLQAENDFSSLCKTGDEVEINLETSTAVHIPSGKEISLLGFGPLAKIIEAGGLTKYNQKALGIL